MTADGNLVAEHGLSVAKYASALELWASVLPIRIATEDLGDYLEGLYGIANDGQSDWALPWYTLAAMVSTGFNGLTYFLRKQRRIWWRNSMGHLRLKRLGLIVVVGVLGIGLASISSTFFEAKPEYEYKFVRLVDSGPMPVITTALNREAERGWEVVNMTVKPGDEGMIYLIFRK